MLSLQAHEGPVRCLAYLPDNRRLVSGGKDGQLILWDIFNARPLDQVQFKRQQVTAVAVSPDGRFVAAGVGKTARLLLLEDDTLGLRRRNLTQPTAPVTAMRFAPDGSFLAASTGYTVNNIRNGGACIWFLDPKTGTEIDTATLLSGHRGATSVAVSPDSQTVAVGRYKATLLWNPVRRENRTAYHLSHWREELAPGDGLQVIRADAGTNSLSYAPDQSLLAAAHGYRVAIHTADQSPKKRIVEKHKSSVVGVDFIAGGEKIACVTERSGVAIRETATGELLKQYAWDAGKLSDGKAAPDGSTFAVAGEEKIIVWDLD